MHELHSPHWRVLNGILAGIRGGAYPPGGKLPSENALAVAYGVPRTAVTSATRILRFGGLLVGPAGGATRVTQEPMRSRALQWAEDARQIRADNQQAGLT